MSSPLRILIVGQGLAGTALAWRLWEQQIPFLIVDPHEAVTSSKIAAGLVTPITGMRLNLSWRMGELHPAAVSFYRSVEQTLGESFYHEVPLVRLFKSEREVEIWRSRQEAPEVQPWLDQTKVIQPEDFPDFHCEWGGFQQRHSGWLDTAGYLEASRQFYLKHHAWTAGRVVERDLVLTPHEVDSPYGRFSHAILCRGAQEKEDAQHFDWLKWKCARGMIVDLQTEANVDASRIMNRGGWLLPRGQGHWRAGSTYDVPMKHSEAESLEEIQRKMQTMLRAPFQITAGQRAVRPILQHRQAVLGRHPGQARLLIFNGLGSKGVLRAPLLSEMLANHLLTDQPIASEVDTLGNLD